MRPREQIAYTTAQQHTAERDVKQHHNARSTRKAGISSLIVFYTHHKCIVYFLLFFHFAFPQFPTQRQTNPTQENCSKFHCNYDLYIRLIYKHVYYILFNLKTTKPEQNTRKSKIHVNTHKTHSRSKLLNTKHMFVIYNLFAWIKC